MRRTQTRLLKTVAGKPHATDDDHESSSDPAAREALPTPPDSARHSRSRRKSEARQTPPHTIEIDEEEPVKDQKDKDEDYLRDPESSGAEDMASGKGSVAGSSSGFVTRKPNIEANASAPVNASGFKSMKKSSILDDEALSVMKPSLKAPPVSSTSIKAPARELSDAELDNSDEDFMRPKKKKARTTRNIHAAPPKVFGSSQNENLQRKQRAREHAQRKEEERRNKSKTFSKIRSGLDNEALPAPIFKRHGISALHGAGATAGAAEDASRLDGSSSPLSSLSPSPEPDSMSIVCETCNEKVDKLLKEEYDDDYVKGKSWNIQWQERFCEWHRTQTAKEAWEKRGYPNIDWLDLKRRMREHHDFLLSVLRKEVRSHYRDEYAAKVKAKSMSNGFKDAAVKPGATVGYYGPRGENVMREHIVDGLSDKMRERAVTDPLISPSGYQGGIPGFVQAVLVPHMAELLIKDDMQLSGHEWEVRARELIAESADVGELVHPEVQYRGMEAEGQDDWVLQ